MVLPLHSRLMAGGIPPGAVHHQVRMLASEGFDDVAVPADRPIVVQRLGNLLRGDLAPLDGSAVEGQQGRLVVVPVDHAEDLLLLWPALQHDPLARPQAGPVGPRRPNRRVEPGPPGAGSRGAGPRSAGLLELPHRRNLPTRASGPGGGPPRAVYRPPSTGSVGAAPWTTTLHEMELEANLCDSRTQPSN